jgi:ribonuclease R
MIMLGEHCSANERRADDATRDVVSWLKCEYMMDKIGEEFSGIISAVTSFGFFVELADIYVEGLVHISNLGQDYFHFDPTSHQLKGERTGVNFRLGDSVKIKVARVDLDEKKMDFELVQKGSSANKAVASDKPKKKRRKKKPI